MEYILTGSIGSKPFFYVGKDDNFISDRLADAATFSHVTLAIEQACKLNGVAPCSFAVQAVVRQ